MYHSQKCEKCAGYLNGSIPLDMYSPGTEICSGKRHKKQIKPSNKININIYLLTSEYLSLFRSLLLQLNNHMEIRRSTFPHRQYHSYACPRTMKLKGGSYPTSFPLLSQRCCCLSHPTPHDLWWYLQCQSKNNIQINIHISHLHMY